MRTIETRFDERARNTPQDRSRLWRQVVPARHLVLPLPLLLMLALGEIDHVSGCGVLAERLLSMQDDNGEEQLFALIEAPAALASDPLRAALEAELSGAPNLRVRFVDALPRNAMGKLLRREARAMALSG